MMKPEERYNWIERYFLEFDLGTTRTCFDVLNRDFVDAYIEATGSRYSGTMYGAAKCKPLGGDLAYMVKAGRLRRTRTGIEGMGGMGFPTWVWSYYIPDWLKPEGMRRG